MSRQEQRKEQRQEQREEKIQEQRQERSGTDGGLLSDMEGDTARSRVAEGRVTSPTVAKEKVTSPSGAAVSTQSKTTEKEIEAGQESESEVGEENENDEKEDESRGIIVERLTTSKKSRGKEMELVEQSEKETVEEKGDDVTKAKSKKKRAQQRVINSRQVVRKESPQDEEQIPKASRPSDGKKNSSKASEKQITKEQVSRSKERSRERNSATSERKGRKKEDKMERKRLKKRSNKGGDVIDEGSDVNDKEEASTVSTKRVATAKKTKNADVRKKADRKKGGTGKMAFKNVNEGKADVGDSEEEDEEESKVSTSTPASMKQVIMSNRDKNYEEEESDEEEDVSTGYGGKYNDDVETNVVQQRREISQKKKFDRPETPSKAEVLKEMSNKSCRSVTSRTVGSERSKRTDDDDSDNDNDPAFRASSEDDDNDDEDELPESVILASSDDESVDKGRTKRKRRLTNRYTPHNSKKVRGSESDDGRNPMPEVDEDKARLVVKKMSPGRQKIEIPNSERAQYILDRSSTTCFMKMLKNRNESYEHASIFHKALCGFSGFFPKNETGEVGKWRTGHWVELPANEIGHPVVIARANASNLSLIRIELRILKSSTRNQNLFIPWVYVAKQEHNNLFALFTNKTFCLHDTLGYLRGDIIWTQSSATKKKPVKKEVDVDIIATRDVWIRLQNYVWSVQRLPILSNDTQPLFMGLHFMKSTNQPEKANAMIEDDGLVFLLRKIQSGTMIVAEVPFVNNIWK